MVACPRCRGVFPIAQGDNSLLDDGHAVAYHGCKVACGATLISSQMFTFTSPSGVAVQSATNSTSSDALMQGFGIVGKGLASRYQDEPTEEDAMRYRGRFQLVDATTGEPVSSQAVRVRSTGVQYITGSTDEDGYTQWVERDARESLAFDLVQDGEA